MKLIVLVPDGMPDWQYPELGGRSPAEYAHIPGMDEIVARGHIGLVKTMYEGLPLGSLVGILGMLGYKPSDYFPLGRSIFEARARGIELAPTDICCRCNIVRVNPAGRLVDFTAGQISDQAACAYLAELCVSAPLELYHDLSYRNILIYRDAPFDLQALELHEPHENVGNLIDSILPSYQAEPFEPFIRLMRESHRDGLMLWPWGAGRARTFPHLSFRLLTVTALSFLSGLSESLGGKAIIPPGATGYRGSHLAGKLDAVLEHLAEFDVCLIHCNAPDEEAHINSVAGKIQALEDIDRQLVAPLLEYMDRQSEPYRLLLCPDHYTVTSTGRHLADLVPFAIAGEGLSPNHTLTGYSETAIGGTVTQFIESWQLIPIYFRGNIRP